MPSFELPNPSVMLEENGRHVTVVFCLESRTNQISSTISEIGEDVTRCTSLQKQDLMSKYVTFNTCTVQTHTVDLLPVQKNGIKINPGPCECVSC